jgi:hypothetical protein
MISRIAAKHHTDGDEDSGVAVRLDRSQFTSVLRLEVGSSLDCNFQLPQLAHGLNTLLIHHTPLPKVSSLVISQWHFWCKRLLPFLATLIV